MRQSLDFNSVTGVHVFHTPTSMGDFVVVLPFGLPEKELLELQDYSNMLFDIYATLRAPSGQHPDKDRPEDE